MSEVRTQVHSLFNQKGGVGKTTITMNLAAVVYETLAGVVAGQAPVSQSPVLVANADPQGSARWWASQGKMPFDYVELRDPSELSDLRDRGYRHIFVDTPGSIEDGQLGQAVLDESDDVLVPLTPHPLAFDPTKRTITKVIQPRNIPFTVVVNQYDPRDGKVDLMETGEFVVAMGWPLCRTPIRHYKVHTRASIYGEVCTQYKPNRVSLEAKNDFFQLALELGYGGTAVAS